MKVAREFSIDNFAWWGGAKDVVKVFAENYRLSDLQECIEEYFDDRIEIPTETNVNDFVWFSVPYLDEFKTMFDD